MFDNFKGKFQEAAQKLARRLRGPQAVPASDTVQKAPVSNPPSNKDPLVSVLSRLGPENLQLQTANKALSLRITELEKENAALRVMYAQQVERNVLLEADNDTNKWIITRQAMVRENIVRDGKQIEAALRLALNQDDRGSGAYSRRYMESESEKIHAEAVRNGHGYAILFVDADHFKKVNDTYGHKAGDEVLKILVDRMKTHERSGRSGASVCRYGGEEFVILLPNCNTQDSAIKIAERFRQAIADDPFHLEDGRNINMTVSIGVGHRAPNSKKPLQEVMIDADMAVYGAKGNDDKRGPRLTEDQKQDSRNRVAYFADNDIRIVPRTIPPLLPKPKSTLRVGNTPSA